MRIRIIRLIEKKYKKDFWYLKTECFIYLNIYHIVSKLYWKLCKNSASLTSYIHQWQTKMICYLIKKIISNCKAKKKTLSSVYIFHDHIWTLETFAILGKWNNKSFLLKVINDHNLNRILSLVWNRQCEKILADWYWNLVFRM